MKNKIKNPFNWSVGWMMFLMVLSGCMKKDDNYIYFYPTEETVKDADGNVYHMVYILGQTWMVENLKTTRYHNGDTIPNVKDSKAWGNLKAGAYCNYDNDTSLGKTYGRLYNWYAVNHGNLCPYPFHVPYDHEWQKLVDTLGGLYIAGGVLKETGTSHWQSNTGATNQYGFTALPGGFLNTDGTFGEAGIRGYWWSNTTPQDFPLSWAMNSDNNTIVRSEQKKEAGFYVRCIRDY